MARNKKQVDKYNSPFAFSLRRLMEDRNVSQADIASKIEVTPQTVSQYYNGISEPSYNNLVRIADYLNVSTDYLLGRTGDPNRQTSAVDELGLDPFVINRIRQIKTGKTMGDRMAQQGMNIFLSTSLKADAVIYKYISQLRDAVEIEKSSTLSDLMIPGTEEASGLTEAERNRMAEVMIWKALEEAYPGITNRVHFTFGHSSIKPRVDEICDLFRDMLEDMTNYKQLKEG